MWQCRRLAAADTFPFRQDLLTTPGVNPEVRRQTYTLHEKQAYKIMGEIIESSDRLHVPTDLLLPPSGVRSVSLARFWHYWGPYICDASSSSLFRHVLALHYVWITFYLNFVIVAEGPRQPISCFHLQCKRLIQLNVFSCASSRQTARTWNEPASS